MARRRRRGVLRAAARPLHPRRLDAGRRSGRRRSIDGVRGVPPHQARSAHGAHPGHLRHGAQRHHRSREGDRGGRRRLPDEAAQPARARRARAIAAQAQGGDGRARGEPAQAEGAREGARRSHEDDRARSQVAAHVDASATMEMLVDGDFGTLDATISAARSPTRRAKAEDLLPLIEDLLEVARLEETRSRCISSRSRPARCSPRSCTSGRIRVAAGARASVMIEVARRRAGRSTPIRRSSSACSAT